MTDDPSLVLLEEHLGYVFSDRELLRRALSHRSYCAEHPGRPSNERLEFLGDAVLGLVVTDLVFRGYAELPEGELAKVRASVVSTGALASVAADLGLGNHVLLGRGEEQSGGREKSSILADTMEAVIGAVYLDGGLEEAAALCVRLLDARILEAVQGPGVHDYKTRLQELAIRVLDETPRYEVTDEGPDHAKEFSATVVLRGTARGAGRGTSKKQAEQRAAAEAWDWLCEHAPASEVAAVTGSGAGTEAAGSATGNGGRGDDATSGGPDAEEHLDA